jgi:glycosyltransferase involved in cell wall biosynthesis
VDFALLNEVRRSGLRERLGLMREHRVVLLPECHGGGINAFETCQAVALKQAVERHFRIIAPGAGAGHDRIVRFARTVPPPCPLVTGDGAPFEELMTAADVLLITPRGDADVTAIAWAMGAGVGVIGTAVYCVAELIASRVNGLLFKQTPGRSMAAPIAGLLDDLPGLDKARGAARGQAYEVFGVRRYVEQTMRLCENLLAGGVPSEGITDPAMTA